MKAVLLRAPIYLAALVLSAGAAAAQTAEAVDAARQAVAQIQHDGVPGPIAVLGLLAAAAIIIVLGLVIRALWATIAARDIIIAGLQDKRAADAATSSKLLAEVATTGSASIAANTEAQAKLTDRMQAFADVVRPLGPDITRAIASLDRNFDRLGDVEKAVGQGCRA